MAGGEGGEFDDSNRRISMVGQNGNNSSTDEHMISGQEALCQFLVQIIIIMGLTQRTDAIQLQDQEIH